MTRLLHSNTFYSMLKPLQAKSRSAQCSHSDHVSQKVNSYGDIISIYTRNLIMKMSLSHIISEISCDTWNNTVVCFCGLVISFIQFNLICESSFLLSVLVISFTFSSVTQWNVAPIKKKQHTGAEGFTARRDNGELMREWMQSSTVKHYVLSESCLSTARKDTDLDRKILSSSHRLLNWQMAM